MNAHQRARIVERRDHTAALWSIRLRTETPLAFLPGQYATLGVATDRGIVERAYSIVSSPHEETIEFYFELVHSGGLTPQLYALGVGDEVLLRPRAKGRFTLDPRPGRNHAFLCTVTGVAPYVSMLRARAHGGPTDGSRLLLIHGASEPPELVYGEELQRLASSLSLEYIPTISRPWNAPDWRGECGRVEDVLRKHLDAGGFSPHDTTAYLCGHPEMINNAAAILTRRGFASADIRQEFYWVRSSRAQEPRAEQMK